MSPDNAYDHILKVKLLHYLKKDNMCNMVFLIIQEQN